MRPSDSSGWPSTATNREPPRNNTYPGAACDEFPCSGATFVEMLAQIKLDEFDVSAERKGMIACRGSTTRR
jgi:hypothetical protein